MNDKTLAIEVKNLGREFKGKKAVENLSLEVSEGEIYAFLGPNGAGKSTTVKMLVTLLEPTSGSAKILGLDTKAQAGDVRLLIGVALQEASLDQSQTGIEFLRLQGRLYGLSYQDIEKRLDDLLSLIDIGDALKKQIKTYSGGMKRRLDLAASIIHQPKVLFLDEPTTGLDPISRAKVWAEVNRLNKELGMTIFLTTQYLEEADKLAERVGIINNGKLVAEGSPQELKNSVGQDLIIIDVQDVNEADIARISNIDGVTKVDINDRELTVSTPSGSLVVGKIALELSKGSTIINSLTLRTTTLDDVFLEVTGNRLLAQESIQ